MKLKQMRHYNLSYGDSDLLTARLFELSNYISNIYDNSMCLDDDSFMNYNKNRFTPKDEDDDNYPICENCGNKVYVDEHYTLQNDDTYFCQRCSEIIENEYIMESIY